MPTRRTWRWSSKTRFRRTFAILAGAMPRPPARPVVKPGDLMIAKTGGGPGYAVSRVVDPRRDTWAAWHVAFASTQGEAIEIARRERAENAIWLQPDPARRRARRVPEP